ncbi:E3 ubiquitin-protein ligase UBR1 [Ceratobasidium sp. AG-Ba]|nr:E3 ubiquitin-protein ligase UBR1 [Ceratobasidium sp. AG-Ba]
MPCGGPMRTSLSPGEPRFLRTCSSQTPNASISPASTISPPLDAGAATYSSGARAVSGAGKSLSHPFVLVLIPQQRLWFGRQHSHVRTMLPRDRPHLTQHLLSVTQPGGCCDCGDPEAWSVPLNCPRHPPAASPSPATPALHPLPPQTPGQTTAKRPARAPRLAIKNDWLCARFLARHLDFSPDDASPPGDGDELHREVLRRALERREHSFDEVIHHLMDTTGITKLEAMQTAKGSMQKAESINLIDIGVTVRRAYDTFLLREIIATELFAPRKKDSSSLSTSPDASRVYTELKDPARIDWLFLYHTRLWKRPRLHLKQIYVSVLTLS